MFGNIVKYKEKSGAGTKIRTRGLMITNQLLYQLSYTGTSIFDGVFRLGTGVDISRSDGACKGKVNFFEFLVPRLEIARFSNRFVRLASRENLEVVGVEITDFSYFGWSFKKRIAPVAACFPWAKQAVRRYPPVGASQSSISPATKVPGSVLTIKSLFRL